MEVPGTSSTQEVVSLSAVTKVVLVVIAVVFALIVLSQLIFVIGKTSKSHPGVTPTVVQRHGERTTSPPA